jgi:three-Cys-motif partner protein
MKARTEMLQKQNWGGSWTIEKLIAFEKYVSAYLTIMNKYRDKNQWKLIYFDAFAGSGIHTYENSIFQTLNIKPEELTFYKGAAERVLGIEKERRFDFYYFIDINEKENSELEKKLTPLKYENEKLLFRTADANDQLGKLANSMKRNKSYRALVLIDPFGMQVNWNSIKQISGLPIDLWILIPTGVIINRLIGTKGELLLPEKLTSFFGLTELEIHSFFYTENPQKTLFGDDEIEISKIEKPIKRIAELYIDRLKTCFKEVTETPLEMRNSNNTPIYHFAFASQNSTAVKIASQIIGGSKK